MSCERYVSSIADRACGAEMSAELAQHLAGCGRCAARLDAERRIIVGLDADIQRALDVEVSESFVRGVHARVAASRRSAPITWWSVAGLGVAASLLVVAALRMSPKELSPQAKAVPGDVSVRPPAAPLEVPRALPTRPRNPSSSRPRVVRALPPVEVIVPPERARAVSEYLRFVRDRPSQASDLDAVSRTTSDPPSDLVVAPLTIDPIVVPDVEIPVRPVPGRQGLQ